MSFQVEPIPHPTLSHLYLFVSYSSSPSFILRFFFPSISLMFGQINPGLLVALIACTWFLDSFPTREQTVCRATGWDVWLLRGWCQFSLLLEVVAWDGAVEGLPGGKCFLCCNCALNRLQVLLDTLGSLLGGLGYILFPGEDMFSFYAYLLNLWS